MDSGKEQVNSKQLMFSAACFIQASSLISSFSTDVTRHETWIAVISGYLISLPVLGMYILLTRAFPGKSIIRINIEVFGNIPGKLLSVLYIYFFFSLAFLNTQIVGGFIGGFVLSETPIVIVYAMFIFVCALAARRGAEVLARLSIIFVVVTLGILVITTLFLIKYIDFSNFLPVFSLPPIKYFQSAHTMAALPFCEIFTFFMLFPYTESTGGVGRALFGGMTIGAVTILVTILRDTAVFGPIISSFNSSNYEAIRLIIIGDTLPRSEVLYAFALMMLMFFKVSILLFAAVKGIAEVLGLYSYKNLVPVIGILVVISALRSFDSAADHAYWGENIAAVYSTFFEVLLPGITLLALAIKNLSVRNKRVRGEVQ